VEKGRTAARLAQVWSRKVRNGRISSLLGSIGRQNKVPKRAELRLIKTSIRTASGWEDIEALLEGRKPAPRQLLLEKGKDS
jgi:hypothetical protein